MNGLLIPASNGIPPRSHGHSRGRRIDINTYTFTPRHRRVARVFQYRRHLLGGAANGYRVQQVSGTRDCDSSDQGYYRHY